MFHFAGFAASDFNSELSWHYPRWVPPFGNLRIKGCLTPPRSLSQSRHVLHRLFVSRHPLYTLTFRKNMKVKEFNFSLLLLFDEIIFLLNKKIILFEDNFTVFNYQSSGQKKYFCLIGNINILISPIKQKTPLLEAPAKTVQDLARFFFLY